MKLCRSFLFLLGLLLTAGLVSADPLIEVMPWKYNGVEGIRLQDTVREHAVWIAIDDLALDPETFEILLPDDTSALAVRDRSWHRADGSIFWTGQLFESPETLDAPLGRIRVSIREGRLSAAAEIDGRRFEVLPGTDGTHRLVELPSVPQVRQIRDAAESTDETVLLPQSLPPTKGTFSRIDVVAVYPEHYLTEDPNIDDKIRSWFDDANLIFANSLVDVSYEPVYIGPVLGDQPPIATAPGEIGVSLGLSWLTSNPAEVTSLRAQWGADLVVLFVPGDEEIQCGVAYRGNVKRPYAVIEIDCHRSEYLVAHELGHVLGLRHEIESDPNGTYDHGFDNANALRRTYGLRAATVMACNGNNNGGVAPGNLFGNQCNRIPYLSAPRTVPGVVGAIGNATQADNARRAREQAPIFAGLQNPTTDPDLPPRISIERPTPNSSLQLNQYITFAASAFDSEDGDLSSSIRWSSSYSGIMGIGGEIRSRFYDFYSYSRYITVTAEVTDSAGQVERVSQTYLARQNNSPLGGIWFSPENPGEFVSFNQNNLGEWVLLWFTRSGSQNPWYLSRNGYLSPFGGWSSSLYTYTWNALSATQTETYAGSAYVTAETDRQLRVTLQLASGSTKTLLFDPLTSGSGVSGIYYAQRFNSTVDDGWLTFRGVTMDGSGRTLSLVATYDGSQPTWAFGYEEEDHSIFEVDLYRPSPDPNGAFDPAYVFRLPTGTDGTDVGQLQYQSNFSLISIGLSFPSGNTWSRGFQTLRRVTIR